MVDTVVVEHPTGATTPDPVTLEEVPVYETVHASLSARVRPPGSLSPREQVAAGYEFGLKSLLFLVPISASGGIRRGDRVTVTALAPTSDPDLLGLVATVEANLGGSHSKQRTLVCEEVS